MLLTWSAMGFNYYYEHYSAESFYEPDTSKLEHVLFKSFSNQEVVLDGKYFEDCTFRNVTLVFEGKRPSSIAHNNFDTGGQPLQIKIFDGPQYASAVLTMTLIYDACRSSNVPCAFVRISSEKGNK